MAAAAVNPDIQYGPADPTLAPPWTTLVDGSTGYMYYWNTETNVTQYEKPGPPLPVGPPPGTVTPAQSQAGAPESHMGGAPNDSINSATNTENFHGMSNAVIHPSTKINNSHSNPHVSPGVITPGNTYGNFTRNPGGGTLAGSGPGGGLIAGNDHTLAGSGHGGGHIAGNGHGGGHTTGDGPVSGHRMGHNLGGGHMLGSAPKNGPNMSGASMHMNAADNPFGGGVRPMHCGGPPVGTPQGMMGRNMHPGPNSNRNFHSNAPIQPKLAAFPMPQMQQGMSGGHMPVQLRQMNNQGNSAGSGPTAPGHVSSFKRPHDDYMKRELEAPQKAQMQGFMEEAPILDLDSYRRHHEISVFGGNVPAPFMTFEAANFPPEIAREVRYLLQAGAYVVRCAAAKAELQRIDVPLWGLHPCGLSARGIVPPMEYQVA